jgi:hypothetical protein
MSAEPEKLTVNCTHCGRKVRFDARLAQRWGKCPGCQAKLWLSRHEMPAPEGKAADEPPLEIKLRDTRRLKPSRGWGRWILAGLLALTLVGSCAEWARFREISEPTGFEVLAHSIAMGFGGLEAVALIIGLALYHRLLRLDWSQNGR